MLQDAVNQLFIAQLEEWQLAQKNYDGLGKAIRKTLTDGNGPTLEVQFNPERIYSSAARVDAKSISERKCFLCRENLPPQHRGVAFGKAYTILVNPFPIFPRHLTIPHNRHTDQLVHGRMHEMLTLARELRDFTIFYNGPRCGASAPDHFHFQAGNKGFMPIEKDFEKLSKSVVKGMDCCRILTFDDFKRQCIILEGEDKSILTNWFDQIYRLMQTMRDDEPEPMMNILASWHHNKWRVFIFPRKQHRPWQFFEEGERQILLSPASVDLGGMLITPRKEDFDKLKTSDILDIFDQICWDKDAFRELVRRVGGN
jgi:ATP adenylyltransferase/5',5'''-P-1,P-4-tetraphosphate phosphorylase II